MLGKEELSKLRDEYLDDENNKIRRLALNRSKIVDLIVDNDGVSDLEQNFNVLIKTLPVTNQMQSGRCWIFAGCNIIRERVAKKYNLENFELSQSYIAMYDKLERANCFMEQIMEIANKGKEDRCVDHLLKTGIEDGGQWDLFVNIVKKYGVVPKNVFPETYQSSHSEEVNYLINRKLKQFASYALEGKENIKVLKELCFKDIYAILLSCYGVPKEKFDFEYQDKNGVYHIIKDLTPKKFYEECCDINLEDYVSIINAPTSDKPFNKTYTVELLKNVIEDKGVFHLNLDKEDFVNVVVKQLKDNEVVWFGSDCMQGFVKELGIWSLKSACFEDFFGLNLEMSKSEMLDTRESSMNHAMVLTGVNIDEGVPTKWKIENSWGEEKGKKGYYVGDHYWFLKYVYQAVINKRYLTNEQLDVLKGEPITLKPWDPIGTLAK